MARKLNYVSALLCLIIAGLLCYRLGLAKGWVWSCAVAAVGMLHLVFPRQADWQDGVNQHAVPRTPSELLLLNEEGGSLASWDIYGKNGIVIGRDVGENHVTVNLDNTDYASMIDVEHAVLNYASDAWYIEDISSKNGVSVQKSDGRKYKLSYGKPCKLEQGDIIFISMARLQIR